MGVFGTAAVLCAAVSRPRPPAHGMENGSASSILWFFVPCAVKSINDTARCFVDFFFYSHGGVAADPI